MDGAAAAYSLFFDGGVRSIRPPVVLRHLALKDIVQINSNFEGDEAPEKRFSGTIIDIGSLPAMSKSLWADSDWRSLKVQWHEPSSILRPDRISPWEVEPLDAANPQSPQPPSRNKRARPPASPSMVAELPSGFGLWKPPSDSARTLSFSEPHLFALNFGGF